MVVVGLSLVSESTVPHDALNSEAALRFELAGVKVPGASAVVRNSDSDRGLPTLPKTDNDAMIDAATNGDEAECVRLLAKDLTLSKAVDVVRGIHCTEPQY
jgi:hypothetical protein